MPWNHRPVTWVSALLAAAGLAAAAERETAPPLEVSPVWSGHPVGFALLTCAARQFVAFYDADRQMTIGPRGLEERRWQLVRLPSVLGWDSHNYVTLAVDSAGQIHVSGNMHCQPLVYFRTQRPYDIASFEPLGHGGAERGTLHISAFLARQERRTDLHLSRRP